MIGRIVVVILAATTVVAAQRGGGGGGGGGARTNQPEFGNDPSASTTSQTTMEKFVSKLKLDENKQVPPAERVFAAGMTQAKAYGQELNDQRRHLLTAELAGNETDRKLAFDAYLEASRKIAAIEASFMSRIFVDLKPDQRKKTVDAFDLLAGIFLPSSPVAAQAGRGRGGDR